MPEEIHLNDFTYHQHNSLLQRQQTLQLGHLLLLQSPVLFMSNGLSYTLFKESFWFLNLNIGQTDSTPMP
jgi:hypothetical protein